MTKMTNNSVSISLPISNTEVSCVTESPQVGHGEAYFMLRIMICGLGATIKTP